MCFFSGLDSGIACSGVGVVEQHFFTFILFIDFSMSSLNDLVRVSLANLGRELELKRTVDYLNSEWYSTPDELRLALEDPKGYQDLKLPGRLKLELKTVLQKHHSASVVVAPVTADNTKMQSSVSNSLKVQTISMSLSAEIIVKFSHYSILR